MLFLPLPQQLQKRVMFSLLVFLDGTVPFFQCMEARIFIWLSIQRLYSTGTFLLTENRRDKTRYNILEGCKIKYRHCWPVCSYQSLRIVKGNFI